MEKILKDMFKNFQNGDKETLLILIEQFKPLINKYIRKLEQDGSESDLLIRFIEIIKNRKTLDIKSDGQIIKYITVSCKQSKK